MIASVRGLVETVQENSLVVEVGGVGLLVSVPNGLARSLRAGESVHLQTYLVVREDALNLYGFQTVEERDFFILLLGVNGVGPRISLAILSSMTVDTIRRAVLQEQVDLFGRVPGVGKKTAQKILLHLQGKVGNAEPLAGVASLNEIDNQVLEALISLGYSVIEAQSAVQSITRDTPADVETRLRIALQYFAV
jgi:holliday junction DNA helicase RuvA